MRIRTLAWRLGVPSNCTEKLIPRGTSPDLRSSILKDYLWSRNLHSSDFDECSSCEGCKTNNYYLRKTVDAIKNKELTVVVQSGIAPYVIFMNQGHSAQLTGYLGELWKMLEETYDFRSIYQVANYTHGCEILASGKADVMLSPIAITASELQKYDYALTYTTSYYQLYLKNKGARANSHFYVYTWDIDLWYAFLGTLFIMSVFFWLISIFRKKNDLESVGLMNQSLHELAIDLKVNLDPRTTSLSLPNSFFCVLEAVTLQGVSMRPIAFSMRVTTVVCLLFGFLMYTAYSAVLVSRLAVIREDSPISNLDDLLQKRSYSLCVRKNANAYSLFQDPDGRLKPEWVAQLNAPPCHIDPTETSQIIDTLCKDDAVIMESNNIMNHHLASFTNCSIIEVSTKYSSASISILVRKDLPYAKMISGYILKIYNAGLISLLKRRWGENRQDPSSQGDTSVTIGHLYNIFVIYFAALSISVLILLTEIAVFQIKKSRKRKAMAKRLSRTQQRRNFVRNREELGSY